MVTLNQLNDTFFPVKKVRHDSHHGYAVVRTDTNQVLGHVSRNYCLIPNEYAVMPFIKKFGIDKLERINTNGHSFFYHFKFDEVIEFSPGDPLQKTGFVANSYDKSQRLMWMYGFFRGICSNGLFSLESGQALSQIHYGYIDLESEIEQLSKNLKEPNLTDWYNLKERPLSYEESSKLVRNFKAFDLNDSPTHPKKKVKINAFQTLNTAIQDAAFKDLGSNYSKNPNGWGLFNNFNWAIQFVCGTKNVTRLISLNKKAEEYCRNELLTVS